MKKQKAYRYEMHSPYFVMLYNQQMTRLIPMTDEDGELAMFETPQDAEDAAQRRIYAKHFGFEIYCQGVGLQ